MSNFKGTATNDNVVIKEVLTKNITKTGLDITSSEDKNQKFKVGVVESLGNLCPKDDNNNPIVKVGDKIMYDAFRGSPVTLDSEVYTIIRFIDIVIVL